MVIDQVTALREHLDEAREEIRQLKTASLGASLAAFDNITFTLTELIILAALIKWTGPCAQEFLYQCIKQYRPGYETPMSKSIEVHISRIRAKLRSAQPPFDPPIIIRIERDRGYLISPGDKKRLIARRLA